MTSTNNKITQVNFTNIRNYCMNQSLLNDCEIVILKVDFSIDKELKEYLLLSKIAKQKEILPLFVLINSKKEKAEISKEFKNESYFTVESDAIFTSLYKEMLRAITTRGKGDISLDIADFKTVLAHEGLAFFGAAQKHGSDAAHVAIEEAIKSTKIKDKSLSDMQGILVYFSIHPDYEIMKLDHAMEIFYEHTHYDAEIIWGTITDRSFSKEYVKVVVLLTGCESRYSKQMVANNLQYKN